MENTGYIALSRQDMLQREMAVIANNLANMNTPAFKSEALMAIEHVTETKMKGIRGTSTVSLVRDVATVRDMTEGPLMATDNPLDLAINGTGYFVLETDNGERYTRHGNFLLNGEGQITNSAGNPLLDDAGQPIVIPQGSSEIEISRDGIVSAVDPENGNQAAALGRVQVVNFDNPYQLKRKENGLLEAPQGVRPQAAEQAEVIQGMVEGSNVRGIIEMTKMIEVTRRYSSASKIMEGDHERIRKAINSLTTSNLS